MRTGRVPAFVLLLALIAGGTVLFAQSAPQFYQRGVEAISRGIPLQDRELLLSGADAFRRAIARNPQYAEARVGLAEALIWLEQYDQAREQIRLARELRHSSTAMDLLEARLMVLTDRIDEARALYRTVLRREPYNVTAQVGNAILALADGATEATMARLRVLEQRFPENRQLLTALVELAWTGNEIDRVERFLAAALHYHGDIPSVQIIAARVAIEGGDAERAEFHARNAITLAPYMEEGWMLLARSAYQRNRFEEARTHYEQLITLNPENERAWYARGALAARTGDLSTAYTSWERASRIRPDFELPRIARENTMIREEPLDSERRSAAAIHYRRTGRELEERFLHRQAERHYRRGLQISPFDRVLRRSLADLYLAQGFRGRYLQELEILADMSEPERELTERIETFRELLRDSLTRKWRVDQFTAPRARTSVAIFYRQSPGTVEPDTGWHIAEYLASLLQTSQNISVVALREAPQDRISALTAAREHKAERVLVLETSVTGTQVRLDGTLLEEQTGGEIFTQAVRRDGVGRVERAVRDMAGEIIDRTTPVGVVLDRRFETVLVSIGSVDRISPEDSLVFRTTPRGNTIGTGTVVVIDDLLAEVRFEPQGRDTLTTGHFVSPSEVAGGTDTEPPEMTAIDEQTSRFTELLKRLFRLP